MQIFEYNEIHLVENIVNSRSQKTSYVVYT